MSSTSTNQAPKSRKKLAIFVTIFSLVLFLVLGVGGIGGLIEWIGVPVFGTEVNRGSLEIRQFVYRYGPFSGRQRSAIVRDTVSSNLVSELRLRKWTTFDKSHHEDWDLASLNGSTTPSKNEIAHCWIVMIEDPAFNDTWVEWINKNPKAAQVLFPAVVELIHFKAYEQIPALLDQFAGRIPNNYSELVDGYLQESYLELSTRPGDEAVISELKTLAAQPFSQRNPALKIPSAPNNSSSSDTSNAEVSAEENVDDATSSDPPSTPPENTEPQNTEPENTTPENTTPESTPPAEPGTEPSTETPADPPTNSEPATSDPPASEPSSPEATNPPGETPNDSPDDPPTDQLGQTTNLP